MSLICMINCTIYIVTGHVDDSQHIIGLHMHGEEKSISDIPLQNQWEHGTIFLNWIAVFS